jgi:polyisoprenoid-binding protein YceI
MTTATTVTPLAQTTGTWVIDPSHTRVGFAARHAMVATVRGQFAEVTIAAASISTSSEDRDTHLRSGDFLDVERHPALTFRSTGVRYSGGDEFVMTGDLTIRGTTRPVELKVELEGIATDPFGNERIGLFGETAISRKDFELTWNVALEAGGVLVSDKVKITLDVSAIRQA